MQVECEPVDGIKVRVDEYRESGGGWIRLAFLNVAGDAGIVSSELAPSLRSVNVTAKPDKSDPASSKAAKSGDSRDEQPPAADAAETDAASPTAAVQDATASAEPATTKVWPKVQVS